MRCFCHSDVNERMNNARPHYTYCGDDVNPPAGRRAQRWCVPDVASNTPTSPCRRRGHSPVRRSWRQQVCLNNSTRRRRDTRRPHYALRCVAESSEDCWRTGGLDRATSGTDPEPRRDNIPLKATASNCCACYPAELIATEQWTHHDRLSNLEVLPLPRSLHRVRCRQMTNCIYSS